MVFKSKIDWWVHLTFISLILINIVLIGMTIASVGTNDFNALMFSTLFYSVISIPISTLWFSTRYIFQDEYLLVKIGFLTVAKVEYKLVESVKGSRSRLSSPALSMDRLEIKYRAKSGSFNRTLIISPVNKTEFVKELNLRSNHT